MTLTYEAEAEELTPEQVVQRVFDKVEVPSGRAMLPGELIRRIRRLEIATCQVVSALLAGQYHSVFKGRGFSEVRGRTRPGTTSGPSSTGT